MEEVVVKFSRRVGDEPGEDKGEILSDAWNFVFFIKKWGCLLRTRGLGFKLWKVTKEKEKIAGKRKTTTKKKWWRQFWDLSEVEDTNDS